MENIMTTVFPGYESFENEELIKMLKKACENKNLSDEDDTINKALQLYNLFL